MTEASQPLIDKALARIGELEAEIAKIKSFINQACLFDGREAMFSDLEIASPAATGAVYALRVEPDAYFGKPLATAVQMILEERTRAKGSTSPRPLRIFTSNLCQAGSISRRRTQRISAQGLACRSQRTRQFSAGSRTACGLS